MNPDLLNQEFLRRFVDEKNRIVFWHDEGREFADYLAAGLPQELSEVEIVEVEKLGAFSTKLRLEKEDPEGRYLVYSHGEAAEFGNDWLWDVRLYSDVFQADMAQLWLREMNLEASRIDYVRQRRIFFNSKMRREKFREMVQDLPHEGRGLGAAEVTQEFDRVVLAVLTKAKQTDLLEIFQQLLESSEASEETPLSNLVDLELLTSFEKMGVSTCWWGWVREHFGYSSNSPQLDDVLRRLLVTDFLSSFEARQFPTIQQYVLPEQRRNNVLVAMNRWRESVPRVELYHHWASKVARELGIDELLKQIPVDLESRNETFREIDRALLVSIRKGLLAQPRSLSSEEILRISERRKGNTWCRSSAVGSETLGNDLAFAYDALGAASEFIDELKSVQGQLLYSSPEETLKRYQLDLYRIDQRYRQFWFYEQKRGKVSESNPLNELKKHVEDRYLVDFLQPLARGWSEHLKSGFLDRWKCDGMSPQRGFFQEHIRDAEHSKHFVIISDALRYEIGVELSDQLNKKPRRDAQVTPLLGSLPSYTQLGMASLLPHRKLEVLEDGNVKVDGQLSTGMNNRSKILEAHGGHAIKAEDFLEMTKDQAREFHKDHELLYIYHNTIDATGDQSGTEGGAFLAAQQAIDDIEKLVDKCINSLNGTKILVTADHGFLFRTSDPQQEDRSKIEVPVGVTKKHKRFFLGRNLGPSEIALSGNVETTSGATGGLEFWIPKGANRFYFTGGARFTHGGAMPQEVVIPLLEVTYARSESLQIKQVRVIVEGKNHRITTAQHRFTLTQVDSVSDALQQRKLKVVLIDIDDGGRAVSTFETVDFNSKSKGLDESRIKEVWLTLESGTTFDSRKEYALVLRDADTDQEHKRISVVIDRSFEDDF